MMARSTTSSNQRPDTLMQDRSCQLDENLLRRTAGPYIRVNHRRRVMSKSCPLSPRKRAGLRAPATSHSGQKPTLVRHQNQCSGRASRLRYSRAKKHPSETKLVVDLTKLDPATTAQHLGKPEGEIGRALADS